MDNITNELKPFQQRVVAEKAELDQRLNSLTEMIRSDLFCKLPGEDRSLLLAQANLMGQLSGILSFRIDRFRAEHTA
jgi:hypothetical protein